MQPLRHQDHIIVKGGRNGNKAHYALVQSSQTDCGVWLKGPASFFKLEFESIEQVREAGFAFCTKCEKIGDTFDDQEPGSSASGVSALSAIFGEAFLTAPRKAREQ